MCRYGRRLVVWLLRLGHCFEGDVDPVWRQFQNQVSCYVWWHVFGGLDFDFSEVRILLILTR